MKKVSVVIALVLLIITPCWTAAAENATAMDVYYLVLKAHDYVKRLGDKALMEFNNPKGEFVMENTYVFVMKCPAEIVAHPFALDKLKGRDLRPVYSFQNALCNVAKNKNGAWAEYTWPKPGETTPSRKLSFIISVEGTPYQVSAGIYDDVEKVEYLDEMISQMHSMWQVPQK